MRMYHTFQLDNDDLASTCMNIKTESLEWQLPILVIVSIVAQDKKLKVSS